MFITNKTIQKLKNHDEETFEKIYYEYENLVYYIAYSITHDKFASEEIVQETFINLFKSLDKYEHTGKFKQYIMMITRNASYNYLERVQNKLPQALDETKELPSDLNEIDKVKEILENSLNKDEYDIVMLKIVHNLKFKEIAIYKNLSLGQVQATYYNALKKLKEEK